MKPETEIRNLKRELREARAGRDSWRDEAARERQKWQASQLELTEVKARNAQLAEQLTLALRAMNAGAKK